MSLVNSTGRLCSHEIDQLELRSYSFADWFCREFPNESRPVKYHMLVHRMWEFARYYGRVGRGSEQAIEHTNKIFRKVLDPLGSMVHRPDKQIETLFNRVALFFAQPSPVASAAASQP